MFLATEVLIFALLAIGWGQNLMHNDSECIFTDIGSRLSVISQIIETTKQILPNDMKEFCRKTMDCPQCPECKTRTNPGEPMACPQCPECKNQTYPGKCIDCPECKNRSHQRKPIDCSDIYEDGERRDGIYEIWIQNRISQGPLRVYCDMESNGGGWTVIQRRGDYKSPRNFFYRDWDSYKIGFGDKLKDFWIGNDNLFALTNQRSYHLRINLTDWEKNSAHAIYDEFWVTDETLKYTLKLGGYNGTAGNSLGMNDGSMFSTKDIDNNLHFENCAVTKGGAWWYPGPSWFNSDCSASNLNGMYRKEVKNIDNGIYWFSFRGLTYSLREVVMKIRPANSSANSPE